MPSQSMIIFISQEYVNALMSFSLILPTVGTIIKVYCIPHFASDNSHAH
jgi:hypothetical protein